MRRWSKTSRVGESLRLQLTVSGRHILGSCCWSFRLQIVAEECAGVVFKDTWTRNLVALHVTERALPYSPAWRFDF